MNESLQGAVRRFRVSGLVPKVESSISTVRVSGL